MIKNLPGIITIILIYIFAVFLREVTINIFNVSIFPLSLICLLFGIVIFNFINVSKVVKAGRDFIKKKILQLAIILLGLKISLFQVFNVSTHSLFLIVVTIAILTLTYYFLCKIWSYEKNLIGLIGIGTAICGISAILASSSVLKSKDRDISLAIIVITLWGSFAIFTYPFFIEWVFITDIAKGIFLGIGIHDTSQVIAAGMVYHDLYQNKEVLEIATITKLFRNLFLAILIPTLFIFCNRNSSNQKIKSLTVIQKIKQTIPLFIIGFIFLILFRSIGDIYFINYEEWKIFLLSINKFITVLFGLALIALGSSIDIKKIFKQELTPILIGLIYSSVAISSLLFFMYLLKLD